MHMTKWDKLIFSRDKCSLPACKAGQQGMDRSRKCGRLLKILLVKSNVTSPYQIRQNIVSRPFLLEDTNLSSTVPRKFSETSTRHMFQKWTLNAGLSTRGQPTCLQLHLYSYWALLIMGKDITVRRKFGAESSYQLTF